MNKCGWAQDHKLKLDKDMILGEPYRDKKGNQMTFSGMSSLELYTRENLYKSKKKLFGSVIGLLLQAVMTHAQPPHTDVPQPRMDLSHGAQTFSEVGTGCTANRSHDFASCI